jgi:hypothetical protein
MEILWLRTTRVNGSEVLLPAFVEIARKNSKKRSVLWENGWIVHQHNALSIRKFVSEKQVPVLDHAPYSPDLLKCALKGTHSKSAEEIQKKRQSCRKGYHRIISQYASGNGKNACSAVWMPKGTTLKEMISKVVIPRIIISMFSRHVIIGV